MCYAVKYKLGKYDRILTHICLYHELPGEK